MLKTIAHKISVFSRMAGVYKNWPRLVAYRLNIAPWPMTVAVRDGARFKVRDRRTEPADAYVLNEMYLYRIHDNLLPYLKNAKVGLDVGAHIGSFSIFAAMRTPAKIIAFEPAPRNMKLLKENIALNKLDGRVIPVAAAVAGKSGTVELQIPPNGGLATMLPNHITIYGADEGPIEKVQVPAFTLADVFRAHGIQFCDFIKMDCEGGEYDILYNAPKEILGRIGVLSIECHADGSIPDLMQYLRERGFEVMRPTMEFGEIFCVNRERNGK